MARSIAAAGFGVLALASCSSVPDAVNPVSWYEGVASVFEEDEPAPEPEVAAEGEEEPFPSLGTVPEPPADAPEPEEMQQIGEGLTADSANAQYTNAEIRRADDEVGGETTVAQAATVAQTQNQAQTTAASGVTESTVTAQPDEPVPAQPLTSGAVAQASNQAVPAQTLGSSGYAQSSPTAVAAGQTAQQPQGSVDDIFNAAFQASGATTLAQAGVPAQPQVIAAARPVTSGGYAWGYANRQVASVFFGDGSTRLDNEDKATLLEVAYAYGSTGGPIRIVGHASQGGGSSRSKVANLDVSMDRAVAVARELAGLGVPSERMFIEAASDTQPVAGGAAQERRVDIFLGG